MTIDNMKFHTGSRQPFPEERPVLEAARRAADGIAERYNKPPGASLFNPVARAPALPVAHRSAMDILSGIPFTDAIVAANGADSVAGAAVARAESMVGEKIVKATTESAAADSATIMSLRQLGFQAKSSPRSADADVRASPMVTVLADAASWSWLTAKIAATPKYRTCAAPHGNPRSVPAATDCPDPPCARPRSG